MPFLANDLASNKEASRGGSAASFTSRLLRPSPPKPPKVGLPREHLNSWNLRLIDSDPMVDARVRALLHDWNMHLIEIPTSFRPAAGTRIVFATLETDLASTSGEPQPRVFRVIPEQVTSATKERTEFGLDPSLEVKDTAKVSLGRWLRTVEIENLKPRVTGFWQEHSAAWELAPESADGVLGTKVFYVVVQQRKGVGHCAVALKVKARVETRSGVFLTRIGSYNYQVSVEDVF